MSYTGSRRQPGRADEVLQGERVMPNTLHLTSDNKARQVEKPHQESDGCVVPKKAGNAVGGRVTTQ